MGTYGWMSAALSGLLGLAPLGAMEQSTVGDDLAIDQVPAQVRQAIVGEAAGQEVRWVQRGEVGGRVVYTARIRQDGLDKRIVVGEDGQLVTDPEWGGSSAGVERDDGMVDSKRLEMSEVPAAVRQTFEREAKGQEIRWIERDLEDGKAVFRARIREDGLDKRLTVDETGALLSKTDWNDDDEMASSDRDLEKDITLEQAPLPVQQALKTEAGAEPIRWVQRDNEDGAMVYKARIRQDGIDKRVTVSPDGKVLEKTDFTEENQKANRAWEKTKEKSGEAWDTTKEKSKEAWGHTKEGASRAWDKTQDWFDRNDVTMKDVPEKARAALQREAAGREIRDVDHELKDGKHVYQAKVHIEDGEDLHVTVDEDGNLLEKKH